MLKINPRQLITRESHPDGLHFRLHNAVFIILEDQVGHSIGFTCLQEDLTITSFTRKLETARLTLQAGASLTAKAIGRGNLVDLAVSQLKRNQIGVGKKCQRREAMEVIYWPKERKVRVAKSQETSQAGKIKVLVVDDSPTVQKVISHILEDDASFRVVACIDHPKKVEDAIKRWQPDVITLDIHMPDQNGADLIGELWPKYKIPAVIVTSLSMEDGSLVFKALENGAIDYIQKPGFNEITTMGDAIREKLRAAASANKTAKVVSNKGRLGNFAVADNAVIAIGSSTGGTEALKMILTALPEQIPPILVVQHIPPIFSQAFANRMNDLCPFTVKEAEDGEPIQPGYVYIAPGGLHMELVMTNQNLFIRISDAAPVNRHKPSVDVLFDSIATTCAPRAVGAILTGMGADGALGLLRMRKNGSQTLAQNEASCIVFGMPREAIACGAAEKVVSLDGIAEALMQMASHLKRHAS